MSAYGAQIAPALFVPSEGRSGLSIRSLDGRVLAFLSFHSGEVTFGAGVAPDAAARAFWEAVTSLLRDNPILTALCAAIRDAEKRLEVDMLRVCLYGDGSGSVMAPARDWGDGGQRTDLNCEEEVCEFLHLEGLLAWLREGKLPEQIEAQG